MVHKTTAAQNMAPIKNAANVIIRASNIIPFQNLLSISHLVNQSDRLIGGRLANAQGEG